MEPASQIAAPRWASGLVAGYAFFVVPLGLLGLVLIAFDDPFRVPGRLLCIIWLSASVLLNPDNRVLPLTTYRWPKPSLTWALTGLFTRISVLAVVIPGGLLRTFDGRIARWSDEVVMATLIAMFIVALGFGIRWVRETYPDIARFR